MLKGGAHKEEKIIHTQGTPFGESWCPGQIIEGVSNDNGPGRFSLPISQCHSVSYHIPLIFLSLCGVSPVYTSRHTRVSPVHSIPSHIILGAHFHCHVSQQADSGYEEKLFIHLQSSLIERISYFSRLMEISEHGCLLFIYERVCCAVGKHGPTAIRDGFCNCRWCMLRPFRLRCNSVSANQSTLSICTRGS